MENEERHPSEADIRAKAHQLWKQRTAAGIPGDDKDDWSAAERELEHMHHMRIEIESTLEKVDDAPDIDK
jgi:hypothetical protein